MALGIITDLTDLTLGIITDLTDLTNVKHMQCQLRLLSHLSPRVIKMPGDWVLVTPSWPQVSGQPQAHSLRRVCCDCLASGASRAGYEWLVVPAIRLPARVPQCDEKGDSMSVRRAHNYVHLASSTESSLG